MCFEATTVQPSLRAKLLAMPSRNDKSRATVDSVGNLRKHITSTVPRKFFFNGALCLYLFEKAQMVVEPDPYA